MASMRPKKLVLSRETVSILTNLDLKLIEAGGNPPTNGRFCYHPTYPDTAVPCKAC